MKIKNFLLISVTEREITVTEFETYEQTWDAMFKELKECPDWDNEWKDIYEEDKDAKGLCESDEFGIDTHKAWANADSGDLNCDWYIHEKKDSKNIIKLARKLIKDNAANEGMDSENPMSKNEYACGVHDGILDIVQSLGIDVQKQLKTDFYN